MNNLIVSYLLIAPDQNESSVIRAIKKCGSSVRVRHSLWYVRSALNASEAANAILEVLDAYDDIVVIDATHDKAAWVNLKPKVADALLREWRSVTHEVTVVDGGYEHQGKRYRSLSAVARAITGTQWSGPLFFGLRKTGGGS